MSTRITVSTEVENHTTRRADPSDNWDIGDESGSVTNVTAWLSEDELDTYWTESLCQDLPDHIGVGSTVFAVVVDYSSGCTFGRTGATGQVLNVFDNAEEASKLAEAALAEDDYSFTYNEIEYRRSWVGYFEQLQSLDVWEITVRSGPQNRFYTSYASEERTHGRKVGK